MYIAGNQPNVMMVVSASFTSLSSGCLGSNWGHPAKTTTSVRPGARSTATVECPHRGSRPSLGTGSSSCTKWTNFQIIMSKIGNLNLCAVYTVSHWGFYDHLSTSLKTKLGQTLWKSWTFDIIVRLFITKSIGIRGRVSPEYHYATTWSNYVSIQRL